MWPTAAHCQGLTLTNTSRGVYEHFLVKLVLLLKCDEVCVEVCSYRTGFAGHAMSQTAMAGKVSHMSELKNLRHLKLQFLPKQSLLHSIVLSRLHEEMYTGKRVKMLLSLHYEIWNECCSSQLSSNFSCMLRSLRLVWNVWKI